MTIQKLWDRTLDFFSRKQSSYFLKLNHTVWLKKEHNIEKERLNTEGTYKQLPEQEHQVYLVHEKNDILHPFTMKSEKEEIIIIIK